MHRHKDTFFKEVSEIMFFTAGLLRDFALMMGTVNDYEKTW